MKGSSRKNPSISDETSVPNRLVELPDMSSITYLQFRSKEDTPYQRGLGTIFFLRLEVQSQVTINHYLRRCFWNEWYVII